MATAKYFNPTTNQWEELSASKLETPRNINGVPFDGSSDITIPTGSGGTSNYADLTNKPQINGVELNSNKSLLELGIEPKRGVDDFYVSAAEKGRLDRLLVDFTVPNDTPSLTFERDKNGVLFVDLGIKNIVIDYYIKIPVTVNGTMIVQLNNVTTATYKQSGALTSGFFARIGVESVGKCYLNICGNILTSTILSVLSNTDTDVNNIAPTNPNQGLNRHISAINSLRLSGNGSVFSSGSNVKIYRND